MKLPGTPSSSPAADLVSAADSLRPFTRSPPCLDRYQRSSFRRLNGEPKHPHPSSPATYEADPYPADARVDLTR
jgi:hypothetical protein